MYFSFYFAPITKSLACKLINDVNSHLYQTIVKFDITIVLPRKLATGSIHDYLFCYCPLVGILFEILRIDNEMMLSDISL